MIFHIIVSGLRPARRVCMIVFPVLTVLVMMGTPAAVRAQEPGVTVADQDSLETSMAATGNTPADTLTTESSAPPRFFWGADNKPLPFKTDAEIMAFMRTADVVSMKNIKGSKEKCAKKVLLEKDGIRMHAIFRWMNEDISTTYARDYCVFECAAYTMGQMLGLYNIPPVVPRKIKNDEGVLVFCIENTMTEETRRKKKIAPFDSKRWAQDLHMVSVFDNLIYNDDRNPGNIVYDQMFTTWMTDHTRAFRTYSVLRDGHRYTPFCDPHPVTLKQCERGVWEKLQTLDDETIKQRLDAYLEDGEMDALLKRRQKLVASIQKLIDEKGEDAVLFTW